MDAETRLRKGLDGTFVAVCRFSGELSARRVPRDFVPPVPPESDTERRVGKRRAVTKWTADEDARLLALRARGMLFRDIARQMGSRGTQACQDHHNVLQKRVPSVLHKGSWKHWPPSEIDRIADMIRDKQPYSVIAARLWRPYHQVRKCIAHLQAERRGER